MLAIPFRFAVRLTLIVAVSGVSAAGAAGDSSIRDDASFQVALTIKILADQTYLLGDQAAAKKQYAEASTELSKVSSEWRMENASLASMLEADIAYRQMLLRYGADFWGATYSLIPMNPVEAFDRFQATVGALSDLVGRMEAEKDKVIAAQSTSAALAAAREAAKTDGDVQALNRVMEEIKGNHHGSKATAAQYRIDSNVLRQKEIASERMKLAAEFDAAHKQLDSLVVNGVLQAAGLPPELASLADKDKPLEQRVLLAGRALLASNNPTMNEAFSGLSKSTASVVESLQQLSNAVEDLEKLKAKSEAAMSAVRRGTLEGALQAGALVYEHLPAADKSRLVQMVTKETKPVIALLESARYAKSSLDAVTSIVAGDARMTERLVDVLAERARENVAGFDHWYRGRLSEVSKAAAGTTNMALLEQAVRAWPKAFFSQLPEEMKTALRQAENVSDDALAATKVLGQWPPSRLTLSIVGGKANVAFGATTATINIDKFIGDKASSSLEAVVDYAEDAAKAGEESARLAMQSQLGGAAKAAMENKESFVQVFASSLHSLDPSTSLARLLPPEIVSSDGKLVKGEADKLFDSLWSKLPDAARAESSERLAVMQAGSLLGKDVVGAADRKPPRPLIEGTIAAGGGNVNEAVLKAALVAACPAAGVAVVAVDALKTLGTMNSLADRMNQLAAEDRSIMVEQLALYDLVRDERAATALADVGIRVAERRRAGADSQIARYDQATEQLGESSQRARRAQRIFMPRAFLLAEQLRARFDQLDRSLAFWTGDPRAPRGVIARNVTADPQWLRHALDPNIQIFRWLERGNESDRGDMNRLVEDWQRKLHLASSVCDSLKCKKDSAVVGEIAHSRQVSLKTMLPSQWRRFEIWKAAGGGDFTFEFLMTPRELQPNKEMHLIRFVAARAGLKRSGAIRSPQGSALYHPGAAYVPFEENYLKEHYLPQVLSSPTWEPFASDLRTRWTTSLALRTLEGYGLYTVWRYTLQDTSENRGAEDVFLQFAYQFQIKDRILNDADLLRQRNRNTEWALEFTTSDRLPLRVTLADLPFFGNEDVARRTIGALLQEPEAAKAGLVGAVRRTQPSAPQ